jgi:hypothetical protein
MAGLRVGLEYPHFADEKIETRDFDPGLAGVNEKSILLQSLCSQHPYNVSLTKGFLLAMKEDEFDPIMQTPINTFHSLYPYCWPYDGAQSCMDPQRGTIQPVQDASSCDI